MVKIHLNFLLEKRRYANALMVNSGQNALDAAPNPDPEKKGDLT